MMGLKCQGGTENNSTVHAIFASEAFLHFKCHPPLSLFLCSLWTLEADPIAFTNYKTKPGA